MYLNNYLYAGESPFEWIKASPEKYGVSSDRLNEMMKNLKNRGTRKLLIIKNDHIIYEWFAEGWEDSVRSHSSASLAKALTGGMSLLVALDDGLLFPDMPACELIPEWKEDRLKSKITIRHLVTHSSGLENPEAKGELLEQMKKKGLHTHMDLPGWKGQFWRNEANPFLLSRDSADVIFKPGSHFDYSNTAIAMLTYAVTASLEKTKFNDIRSLLWERIYKPIGIQEEKVEIGYGKTYSVNNLSLAPSWGGGKFTADAVARIGQLMLHKGNWQGSSLVSPVWVEKVLKYADTPIAGSDQEVVSSTFSLRTKKNPWPAPTLGWYTNNDGIWEHVPRDAFAGAGANHQLLFVVPSLDLIVVRFGKNLTGEKKNEDFWSAAEEHLFNPIMDVIVESPYQKSTLITSCTFAHKSEIVRLAEGSDNWPLTWADDDNLYTAYGDGWGFKPGTDIKLSLGLAKVKGSPPNIKGLNIRTNSGERVGQGKNGVKASGMLFIDGVLYMLTRNSGNAQLAWSNDYGKNWLWADWKFDISFGCPTFLNFGKNYSDARDDYVYIYSHDESSAYKIADQMVLARVAKDKIKQWQFYEYFAGYDEHQNSLWTEDIRKRRAVFKNPGKCYRSGISYNSKLRKYLWCQIIPLANPGDKRGSRFDGGLGIFEASEPWGPWKTVFYSRKWDVGPGETGSISPKWISEDGNTCYYIFSGDDYFSIREVKFGQ